MDNLFTEGSGSRIYRLMSGEDQVSISIKFEFLDDETWTAMIESHITRFQEYFDENIEETEKMRTYARGLFDSSTDVIYIRKFAREHEDFRWLILHELGHAICDFDHTDTKGSLMHSNYKYWYK